MARGCPNIDQHTAIVAPQLVDLEALKVRRTLLGYDRHGVPQQGVSTPVFSLLNRWPLRPPDLYACANEKIKYEKKEKKEQLSRHNNKILELIDLGVEFQTTQAAAIDVQAPNRRWRQICGVWRQKGAQHTDRYVYISLYILGDISHIRT